MQVIRERLKIWEQLLRDNFLSCLLQSKFIVNSREGVKSCEPSETGMLGIWPANGSTARYDILTIRPCGGPTAHPYQGRISVGMHVTRALSNRSAAQPFLGTRVNHAKDSLLTCFLQQRHG